MRLKYSCISWYSLFSTLSCEGFIHLRGLQLSPMRTRLSSQNLFSSTTDIIDESKKYVYEKGLAKKYGSHKVHRTDEHVFYQFWKIAFCDLDIRVISGDVSTIDGKEFEILGGYPGRIIVVRRSLTTNYGHLTAVFDSQNPFRVFVGQSFTKLIFADTIGGIIYVNKEGLRIDSKPFSAKVFSEDFRNGHLMTWSSDSWSPINVFLCGDTLILYIVHRDMRCPTLQGVILKEDEVQSTFEIVEKMKYPNLNGLHLGRWLCIRRNLREKNEDTLCYDLKSFRADTSENLIYDRVIVSAAGGGVGENGDVASPDLIATLESLEDVSSYDITNRDGYPVKCIKCGQDTVEGTYYSNRNASGGYSSIYLGKAACVHCSIRYSLSNERWECFLANPTLRRCSCPVQAPDYKCSSPHASRVRYSVKLQKVAPEKKGYQQEISFEVFQDTESPK